MNNLHTPKILAALLAGWGDAETTIIEGDIELDFVPKSMVWLGIAEEGEGHDH